MTLADFTIHFSDHVLYMLAGAGLMLLAELFVLVFVAVVTS